LQNLERELLLYLDKQMDKYKYNVTDITKFKEDFKSFLSTLDNNFEFLADEIKKEYKFDISKEVIRDIFSFYDTNPNDDD
jgi:glutaredoxin-related protein